MARSLWSASILLLLTLTTALLVTGCGGGGGGGGDNTNGFVITGRVQDHDTGSGISGATVLIAGQSDTTDSNGDYRVEFETEPSASTWRVTSPVNYYSYWAKLGQVTEAVNPEILPMPAIINRTTTMPTVRLLNSENNPPPFPVD